MCDFVNLHLHDCHETTLALLASSLSGRSQASDKPQWLQENQILFLSFSLSERTSSVWTKDVQTLTSDYLLCFLERQLHSKCDP